MADNTKSTGSRGEGTYQMLWDCKFCGTEKLLGVTHRHCPNCGAAQDTERRYFPAEEDMVALEDHKYVGADKICPACRQPNSAASTYCVECGADLAAGAPAVMVPTRDLGTGGAESNTRRDVVQDNFNAEMMRIAGEKASQPVFLGLRKNHVLTGGVIAAVLVIIAGIVLAVTYRRDASGTVSALTWARTVEIEEFRQVSGSDWDESVPGDAYNVSCRREQRGTERVQVGSHQECQDVDQGDGSFRRQCRSVPDYESRPVYDERCSYRMDRWVTARAVDASGDYLTNPSPAWPVFSLAGGSGGKSFGREREGAKRETYRVVMDFGGDKKSCNFSQAKWESFKVGMRVTVKVGLTGAPDCDTLRIVQ